MAAPPHAATDAATLAAAGFILAEVYSRVSDAVFDGGLKLRRLGLADQAVQDLLGSLDGLLTPTVVGPAGIPARAGDQEARSA